MYKEAREAEAQNAEVVQQLRVELARHECASAPQHNSGMMKHNVGMTNGDLQQTDSEMRDRIAHLQSQLRYVHQCCFLE